MLYLQEIFFPIIFSIGHSEIQFGDENEQFSPWYGKRDYARAKIDSPPPGFMFSLPTNGVRLFFVNIEYEKNLIFLSLNGIASISAYIHDFMGIIKEGENPPRKKPF